MHAQWQRVAVVGTVAASVLLLSGCATSRADQLRKQSERVEAKLVAERDRVVAMQESGPALPGPSGGPPRVDPRARLTHLSTLRMSLSAANIALSAVPWTIPQEQRGTAYDVLGEVYSTIDWNIPLMPGEAGFRMMPAEFRGNTLNLSAREGMGAPAAREER